MSGYIRKGNTGRRFQRRPVSCDEQAKRGSVRRTDHRSFRVLPTALRGLDTSITAETCAEGFMACPPAGRIGSTHPSKPRTGSPWQAARPEGHALLRTAEETRSFSSDPEAGASETKPLATPAAGVRGGACACETSSSSDFRGRHHPAARPIRHRQGGGVPLTAWSSTTATSGSSRGIRTATPSPSGPVAPTSIRSAKREPVV